MTHTAIDPSFHDLIDEYSPVGQIGRGFIFTEGPIWHPIEQYLLFSDMPGDVRRRWDLNGGVKEVQRPSNKGNGMTYDADLNLLVCEHATSSVVRIKPDGEVHISLTDEKDVELEQKRSAQTYSPDAETKRLSKKLRQSLEKQADQEEAAMQQAVTETLEAALDDLRKELDDAVTRATGAALKEKARQLGEVQEVSENHETGELTIRVKV